MSSELSIIGEITEEKYPAIYGKSGLDHFYDKVKEQVSTEVPDTTTAKGRARIASLAANVSRSKTAVEKPGREYLKQLKDLPRKIEAELRDFADKMDKLRDETRKPLTDWEEAEKQRIAAIQSKIDWIVSFKNETAAATSAQVSYMIETLSAEQITETFQEFEAIAHREKADSLSFLSAELERIKKQEAEAEELARLLAEAEERAKKEREEKIAREAAEQARKEAEEKAANEKAAAERREVELKRAAEDAERRKAEAEQAALEAEAARKKAEQEAEARAAKAAKEAEERTRREAEDKARKEAEEIARREADKKHRARINNSAAQDLISAGFTEGQARQIVILIASGKVSNVKINY